MLFTLAAFYRFSPVVVLLRQKVAKMLPVLQHFGDGIGDRG